MMFNINLKYCKKQYSPCCFLHVFLTQGSCIYHYHNYNNKITLHLSSSFGTILSVFFLYSVYPKRIRLQMNEALLGRGGGGMMLVPSLNFKTGCFALWGGGHYPVCCGTFNQFSCHLLPFLLSFKAMPLAKILPYLGLDLNTKAWPDCATIDKSWQEKHCTIVTICVIIQFS